MTVQLFYLLLIGIISFNSSILSHCLSPVPSTSNFGHLVSNHPLFRELNVPVTAIRLVIARAMAKGSQHYVDARLDASFTSHVIQTTEMRIRAINKNSLAKELEEAGWSDPQRNLLEPQHLLNILSKTRVILIQDPDDINSPLILAEDWQTAVPVYWENLRAERYEQTVYLPKNLVEELVLRNNRRAISALLLRAVFQISTDAERAHIPGDKLQAGYIKFSGAIRDLQPHDVQLSSDKAVADLLRDYFQQRRASHPKASLLIIHTNDQHDPNLVAKAGVDKLLKHPAVTSVYENQLADSYMSHWGRRISYRNAFMDTVVLPPYEKRFVFTGGNFSASILGQFGELVENLAGLEGEWQMDLAFGGSIYDLERKISFERDRESMTGYLERFLRPYLRNSLLDGEKVSSLELVKEETEHCLKYHYKLNLNKGGATVMTLVFWKDIDSLLHDLDNSNNPSSMPVFDRPDRKDLITSL